MFHHIEGSLAYKDRGCAVIDCGGVGYRMTVSSPCAAALPREGERVKLYTHMVVRDDAVELLGFSDMAERSAFQMLISVSGVGPKVAMSVLSALGADRFALAVVSNNHKDIALARGVSVKTAQKIILELKDKLNAGDFAEEDGVIGVGSVPASGGVRGDALDSLVVLGFPRSAANRALDGVDLTLPITQVIKEALKVLGKAAP